MIYRSHQVSLAVLAEEAQSKSLIIPFLVHEYDVGFAFLFAWVDGLAEVIFGVGVTFCQLSVPVAHVDAQLVEAGVSKLLAVILSTQFADSAEGGAELLFIIFLDLSELMWTCSPELLFGLASQSLYAQSVVLHPLLAIGGADLKDLIYSYHVIWKAGACLGLQLDEEAVELPRVDVLDGFGVATRPLAEGGEEGRAYLGGAMKEDGLAAIEALLDTVAGQQQVQYHLLVLLFLVDEAEQVPHCTRISSNPMFPDAPFGLPDEAEEEKGFGVVELEEPGDILEDFEYGQIVEVVAQSGHVLQNGQDLGHLSAFVELGRLVAERNGRRWNLCDILLHNYLIISLQDSSYLHHPI